MQNIFIGLGVVAVAAGGVYIYTSQRDAAPTEENLEMTSNTNQDSARDFAAIMAAGDNVHCTVTHTEDGNQTFGNVYVADHGERVRGDFTITGTLNTEMHLVRDEDTNYMWGPAFPEGVKMSVTDENRDTLFESEANAAIPDNVSFSCNSWRVDDAKFTLPNDVTFVDLKAQMDAMMQGMSVGRSAGFEGSADVRAMQCASCDQAGSARTQCRTALGCDL